MLSVFNLSKSFNLQTLFENISFSINPGERIGLIGPNGCGKTTLLRILAGEEKPTAGHVQKAANLRIGYLTQTFNLPPKLTIKEIIGREAGHIEILEEELIKTADKLAQNPQDSSLVEKYDQLLHRIQTANIGQAESILNGLELNEIPSDLAAENLSGGQKTRLSLALVLLGEPQILLLDEPTNHLDITMLEWLENWLARSPCGALIVSHDRVFLDRTVTSILEIYPNQHNLKTYAGNYSDYVEQRQNEFDKQMTAYKDQQDEIKRLKTDINRTRAQASHAEHQASSIRVGGPDMKIKGYKDYVRSIAKGVAQKAKAREKRLERYLESEERVDKPYEDRTIRIDFDNTPHLGQAVITLENLDIGYDPNAPLLKNINLQILSNQRIAISGANGCGKTTLLHTIAGILPALKGNVHLGSSVVPGLLSQDTSLLPPERSALDIVMDHQPDQTAARYLLVKYLISGEDVFKPSKLLSSGQQIRLMLALLVLNNCNVLLLDEPTNHLDISSRTQFEDALNKFNGAILMVTHDRYIIERFAQVVWQIKDGQILFN